MLQLYNVLICAKKRQNFENAQNKQKINKVALELNGVQQRH